MGMHAASNPLDRRQVTVSGKRRVPSPAQSLPNRSTRARRRLQANNAQKSRRRSAAIEQIRFRSEFRRSPARPPFVGPPPHNAPSATAQPTRPTTATPSLTYCTYNRRILQRLR